ncbi:MFS transporter [Streptomyces sp. NPDC005046]
MISDAIRAFTAALAAVPDFTVFLILRFLAGIGLGGVWSVVSAYVVETWPAESRGRAAAFVISAFPAGGAIAAAISGWFLPDWRTMFLIAGTAVIAPVAVVLGCSGSRRAGRRRRPRTRPTSSRWVTC